MQFLVLRSSNHTHHLCTYLDVAFRSTPFAAASNSTHSWDVLYHSPNACIKRRYEKKSDVLYHDHNARRIDGARKKADLFLVSAYRPTRHTDSLQKCVLTYTDRSFARLSMETTDESFMWLCTDRHRQIDFVIACRQIHTDYVWSVRTDKYRFSAWLCTGEHTLFLWLTWFAQTFFAQTYTYRFVEMLHRPRQTDSLRKCTVQNRQILSWLCTDEHTQILCTIVYRTKKTNWL